MGIYESRRTGKLIFIAISALAIIIFLIVSNNLVKELAQQEKERMDIWARATERLAKADVDTDIEFLLAIISQNNSIPVMVSDGDFNIVEYRNYKLPDKTDSIGTPVFELSDKNRTYLVNRLKKAAGNRSLAEVAPVNPHFIVVEVYDNTSQYIYYEDSILLRRLSLYPYVQLLVMVILVIVIYLAVIYTKKAEQNRVWVGLSKETAHQLGTPISSLMAWTEYLEATGADPEVTAEIDKDVKRLSTIADRFSKIGSQPEVHLEYINDVVGSSLGYMKNRISGKVKITMNLSEDDHGVMLSRPLFEWVMENLTKNAVDAMAGEGSIDITTGVDHGKVVIEVRDTGKGIQKKNFKTVFNPGYTTKKRGWGLGLTLVKRIIEDYHGGKIFVKESEVGKGTTFRIELPQIK
ncbi:MAG: HAMP domain-containing histidine kinase [Muribaculum sp.]|nr:HAMP domain-containing histidine kinase [Muribaculum sp.]